MTEIIGSSLLFLTGLYLLIVSSDWLIQGSVRLAFLFRLAPLFIGMVLVAFGTSAPEAGVSIIAAVRGENQIALSNIVGSNICNIGLILGVCAMVNPLAVKSKAIFKREMPIMLAAAVLLYIFSLDLLISRTEGLIFIAGFIIFCFITFRGARGSQETGEIDGFKFKKLMERLKSPWAVFAVSIFAVSGVVFGADLMVRGGSRLAKFFGVSPWIIGVTIFAIGTSLPELAASMTASLKKAPSIGVGNIVGSNIFNILLVLGIAALIRPISLAPSVLKFEMPVLLIFSGLFFITMRTKYRVTRKEGIGLVFGYIIFLFIAAKQLFV